MQNMVDHSHAELDFLHPYDVCTCTLRNLLIGARTSFWDPWLKAQEETPLCTRPCTLQGMISHGIPKDNRPVWVWHFRFDLAYITHTCTHWDLVSTAWLIVQVFTSPYGIRTSPYCVRMTNCMGVFKPILSTGACTLSAHKPYGNQRLHVYLPAWGNL